MVAKTGTKHRGRMRVLCVALWRTRPSVFFVLEARFSPIDKTPCFNANPHRRSSPYAVFPPQPLPLSLPVLSRSYTVIARYWARIFGRRLPRAPFEKSMSHQSSDISSTRAAGDFSDSAFRTLDRSPGNDRKPATTALTTLVIDTATSNWQEQYRIATFGRKGERRIRTHISWKTLKISLLKMQRIL